MAEGVPGFGELFGALGGVNPLNAIGKGVEQFRRAVDDLLNAVETFTETMDTLNTVAGRVNRILDNVEEPMRLVVPQISATVRAAETMVNQLTGPIDRVSPLLSSFAEALSTPTLGRLPVQLGEFLDALGEVTERMAPLGQVLESAGGLFRLNPLRQMLNAFDVTPPPPPPPPPHRPMPPTISNRPIAGPSKRSAGPAKRPSPKVAPVTGAAATPKAATRKAATRKAATRKAATRKAATRKTATRKTATRKTAARTAASPTPATPTPKPALRTPAAVAAKTSPRAATKKASGAAPATRRPSR